MDKDDILSKIIEELEVDLSLELDEFKKYDKNKYLNNLKRLEMENG